MYAGKLINKIRCNGSGSIGVGSLHIAVGPDCHSVKENIATYSTGNFRSSAHPSEHPMGVY